MQIGEVQKSMIPQIRSKFHPLQLCLKHLSSYFCSLRVMNENTKKVPEFLKFDVFLGSMKVQ